MKRKIRKLGKNKSYFKKVLYKEATSQIGVFACGVDFGIFCFALFNKDL